LESFPVLFGVFDQYVDDQFVFIMLCSKVCGLVIIAALSTHRDSRIEIKLEITRRLDELFKFIYILELCITVQEQGCVISGCFVMFVQLLEVLD
jgi:cytosine/uracil/thiamine/allantoin permease